MAPNAEVEDILTMTSSQSKVHSLKDAIFHTMAYKLSLEINKNKITPKTIIAFLKVLWNVAQIKTKKITFEQYSRIHLAGPKIAICETASNAVFVLNSAFTSKDQYFKTAIQEAILAFNNVLKDFGYHPNPWILRPLCASGTSSAATSSVSIIYKKLSLTFILLFNCISSSFLHLSSMMHRIVVADHSSKERWHFSLLHAHPPDGQHHPSPLGSSILTTCFCKCQLVFTIVTAMLSSFNLTGLFTLLHWAGLNSFVMNWTRRNSLANFKLFICRKCPTVS